MTSQIVRVIGSYGVIGRAREIHVKGSYAYLTDGDMGLRILDVSNPAEPREVGTLSTPSSPYEIRVMGTYAYVADYDSLRIIDVSTPTSPIEVSFFDRTNYSSIISTTYFSTTTDPSTIFANRLIEWLFDLLNIDFLTLALIGIFIVEIVVIARLVVFIIK
ncbi:MAG: LVIVD repeat-containing protein [Candidatus Hermodarchaeota archaeon]